MTTTERKGQNMRHDETRDNTTAIEAVMMAADSAEDILVALGHSPEAAEQMANPSEPDPAGVRLETDPVKVAKLHDEIVAKARQQSEERFEEINDGANGYDEDEPEDDGQPSEYDEWQDYMGGDEYYDHSENACW